MQIGFPDYEDTHRRAIAATIDGVRVVCFYVPNGQSVDSDKYQYKLEWLRRATDWLRGEVGRHERLAVSGDFNVAPEDRDVHDPELWRGQVLCTDAERAAYQGWIALGLVDSYRLFEQPERSYSWWDYRMLGFQKNRGLRIDHVLLSPALAGACQRCCDRSRRTQEGAAVRSRAGDRRTRHDLTAGRSNFVVEPLFLDLSGSACCDPSQASSRPRSDARVVCSSARLISTRSNSFSSRLPRRVRRSERFGQRHVERLLPVGRGTAIGGAVSAAGLPAAGRSTSTSLRRAPSRSASGRCFRAAARCRERRSAISSASAASDSVFGSTLSSCALFCRKWRASNGMSSRAFAQRRQAQADDVEAMEQVLAEQPLPHALVQVLVRRRDDAHARLQRRMAADPVVLAVRQHAQQPHLQVERHVADLVEEQRAAFGLLETSAALRLRAGERAALVAEQLRFEQVLRDRRGVDRDERPAARGLCLCSARATSSLPVPDSPVISTVALRLRQPADGAKHVLHRRRLAEHLGVRATPASLGNVVARLSSPARRISASAWSTSNGLGRYSNAPPWNAATALSRSE